MTVVIVAASIALVLAVAFGRLARLGRPWMVPLGLLTYPLYLLHDEVSNVTFTHWHSVNRWLLLPLVGAVVVALSVAVHLLVERPLAPRLRAALNGGLARLAGPRAGAGPGASAQTVPAATPTLAG